MAYAKPPALGVLTADTRLIRRWRPTIDSHSLSPQLRKLVKNDTSSSIEVTSKCMNF